MLTKVNLLTFVPGSPGRPAIAARPATPAWEETITETVVEIVPRKWVLGGVNVFSLAPPGEGAIAIGWRRRTVTRTYILYHPAIPAVLGQTAIAPTVAQWKTSRNLGWNSGAHSVLCLAGDVQANFKLPNARGVMVGFNHTSRGVMFAEIAHGLYFNNGTVRVYEAGVPKGEVTNFDPPNTFYIERVNAVVGYYRQIGSAERTLLYQSLVPSTRSVVLDVSMYSGGDRID